MTTKMFCRLFKQSLNNSKTFIGSPFRRISSSSNPHLCLSNTTHFHSHSGVNTAIPVINMESFVSGSSTTSQMSELANELCSAGKDVGFFYISGHGVAAVTIQNIFQELKHFFALPAKTKMQAHTSLSPGVRGYIGMYEQGNYGLDVTDKRDTDDESVYNLKDAKEVFTLGTELPTNHKYYHHTLYAENLWPSSEPSSDGPVVRKQFRTAVERYYEEMSILAQHVYSLFALALDLDKAYFRDKTISTPMTSLNMIHYPPREMTWDEKQMGIGAHTDFECFTLLCQDEQEGLQILNNEGNWQLIPPIPGTFVVNIGDIMARWSNDRFQSTVHRAVNHPTKDRFSIACFCGCDFDVNLRNLTNEQDKYKPICAGEHMLRRVHEANLE